MVVGLPIGIVIARFMCKKISTIQQIYPYPNMSVWMYFVTYLGVLFFVLASHFIAMLDMRKWNIPERVKERE